MATASSRPGGLTALAVLNFIFAGLKSLALLASLAAFVWANQATGGKVVEEIEKTSPIAVILLSLAIDGVNVILMLISGIGYIGQKKVLGRILGSAYGLLAIGGSIAVHTMMPEAKFNMLAVAFLVYPALTLILLNTAFRDDFINP